MSSPASSISPLVPAPGPSDEGATLASAVWNSLLSRKLTLGLPDLQIQPLDVYRKQHSNAIALSEEDKVGIKRGVLIALEYFYPHLPFKTEYGVGEGTLDAIRAEDSKEIGKREWHEWLSTKVGEFQDTHTLYGLPDDGSGAVAFLPFSLAFYLDKFQKPHFVVASIMVAPETAAPILPSGFGVGSEILTWNGQPVDSDLMVRVGFNPEIRLRDAANVYFLRRKATWLACVRPLRYCRFPHLPTVTLCFQAPDGGAIGKIDIPWAVATGMHEKTCFPSTTYSVCRTTQIVTDMHANAVSASVDIPDRQRSKLPEMFQFQYSDGVAISGLVDPARLRCAALPDARFGYIRIRAFQNDTSAVEEFRRILHDVMNKEAPDGLVLDVRTNAGGDIVVAEQLLQMLTPAPITPMNFHLANTPPVWAAVEMLRELQASSPSDPAVRSLLSDLKPWLDSQDDYDVNAKLSPGFPLTRPGTGMGEANAIGQVYKGKCALLVDGATYSAAGIFAAGFQDHSIGPVLGVDRRTGGGGANVWNHDHIVNCLTSIESLPAMIVGPLPAGATLSLSIRRAVRAAAKDSADQPSIEDSGVVADVYFCEGSPDEVLGGSQSIVQFACDHLTAPRSPALTLVGTERHGDTLRITLQSKGFDFVQIEYLDGSGNIDAVELSGGPNEVLTVSTNGPNGVNLHGCYYYPTSNDWNFVRAEPLHVQATDNTTAL